MDTRTAISVVLLEDEALITLDVEDMLRDAGFKVHDIVGVRGCLGIVETNTPDVAVLDIELRDGTCVKVAETLRARNIPFVILSGSLPEVDNHAPIFLQGKWVTKPSSPQALSEAVEASLAMASGFSNCRH